MKLLYVFPEEFAGRYAREYHVYRLADSLAAAGCDVTLAAAPSDKISSKAQLHEFFGGSASERLKIVWLKREFSLGPWKIRSGGFFYRKLSGIIASGKFDGAFTMHLKAADFLAKRHANLSVVFEAHEIFSDTYEEGVAKHRQLLELEKRVYRHVRGVVAISSFLAKTLHSRFGLELPIHVQHDGIDEAMLLGPDDASDPCELIYTGSLQPWKGVPVAVAAMKLLPEYHLTVIGGEGPSLEKLRADAPSNVTFLGQLTREALRPYLKKAAIGLMPNLLEPRSALYTFPLKLLEYSAAGKGIVASEIPVFDDLEVGAWVELFKSGSAEGLAAAVRACSARGVDRQTAQAWASKFIWERQGADMKAFLETIFR